MTGRWRLKVLTALAAAALSWERLWPRLWPAAAIVGTFLAVAGLDLLPRLPGWLHAGVLAAGVLGLLAVLVRAWPALRPVSRRAAERRLERDSGLAHRPLAAAEDRLAAGRADPLAETLWQRHRQQMAARLGRLRLAWPRSDIARVEPYGVRAGVLLLLTVGLATGWHDYGDRLARAVDPGLGLAAARPPLVEVWLAPPAYTRAPPQFVTSAGVAAEPLTVPAGSSVLARVQGTGRAPTLVLGDAETRFAALGSGAPPAFAAEALIAGGERLAVVAGRRTLAAWRLHVVADRPPSIDFAEAPAAIGNGGLAIPFTASDDYGVTAAAASIRRADDGKAGEIRIELPLAAVDPTVIEGISRQDLSAHPWAGEAVTIELEATDAAGQVGRSAPFALTLPERSFHHPVARAIVAARKRLTHDEAALRRSVAAELAAIAAKPDAFDGDVTVVLALAVAKSRLGFDRRPEAIDSVRALLWSTALRLEEGDVPAAERALAEAEQRLREKLAERAGEMELERAMDELAAALERYLEALAQELMRRGGPSPTLDPRLTAMPSADLQQMLEAMRQLVRAGDRRGAERLLADMQQLLDQLRAGLPLGGLPPELAEAAEVLEALRQLEQRQQGLLDETFDQLRAMQERLESGRRQPAPGRTGAEAQQQLRSQLQALIARSERLLGNAPGALGEADQAMGAAARALGQGRLSEGANRQGQALDALGRALDALGEELVEAFGPGLMLLGPGMQPGSGDAFGRYQPGGRRGGAIGSVPIPDASALKRAQEILQELRRRAGDRLRPQGEREYIERMLRRY